MKNKKILENIAYSLIDDLKSREEFLDLFESIDEEKVDLIVEDWINIISKNFNEKFYYLQKFE